MDLQPVPVIRREPRGVLSPVVKWVGGKRKLLPALAARMPATYGRYFEPFVGSAALYLHAEPEHAVLADTNADLIGVYRDVAHRVDSLISDLEWHASRHSTEFYYEVRDRWNTGFYDPPSTARSAAFIYLNKTCFNGLWRVNGAGEFNVPVGSYDDPKILDAIALRAAAPAFARADLRACSYLDVITAGSPAPGDFVYFDPPYIPMSPSSNFTAYTPGGFRETEQRALADTALALALGGVQVMVSNSDTPFAWELYGNLAGFRIERVSRSGTVNASVGKRQRVSELLITSGYKTRA